jgi:hypothetical protein
MAERLVIILEIVATIFISIQFLTTRNWHTKIDKWLLKRLSRKISPRGKLRTFVLTLALTLTSIIILGFIVWGATQDLKNPNANLSRLMILNGLSLAGFILSVVIVFAGVNVLDKIKEANPTVSIITVGFIFGAVTFILPLAVHANVAVITFYIFFSAGIIFTSLWLGVMPYLQKYFTFKSGVLIRFGIVIFIVAKIFQLVSMK